MEQSEATKTLLGFMISSVAGSYRDMVALIPVVKLDSYLINDWFKALVVALEEIGFSIQCVITDGHSSNRKFLFKIESSEETENITRLECDMGHKFRPILKQVVFKLFNVLSKNLAAKKNDEIHRTKRNKSEKSICERKKKKLTSE